MNGDDDDYVCKDDDEPPVLMACCEECYVDSQNHMDASLGYERYTSIHVGRDIQPGLPGKRLEASVRKMEFRRAFMRFLNWNYVSVLHLFHHIYGGFPQPSLRRRLFVLVKNMVWYASNPRVYELLDTLRRGLLKSCSRSGQTIGDHGTGRDEVMQKPRDAHFHLLHDFERKFHEVFDWEFDPAKFPKSPLVEDKDNYLYWLAYADQRHDLSLWWARHGGGKSGNPYDIKHFPWLIQHYLFDMRIDIKIPSHLQLRNPAPPLPGERGITGDLGFHPPLGTHCPAKGQPNPGPENIGSSAERAKIVARGIHGAPNQFKGWNYPGKDRWRPPPPALEWAFPVDEPLEEPSDSASWRDTPALVEPPQHPFFLAALWYHTAWAHAAGRGADCHWAHPPSGWSLERVSDPNLEILRTCLKTELPPPWAFAGNFPNSALRSTGLIPGVDEFDDSPLGVSFSL
ncbi:MAG: hypothetical protein VX938_01260, partial [Myxococcota bacterium]|nr:hypothetical protein [Myxococcota bacterium]